MTIPRRCSLLWRVIGASPATCCATPRRLVGHSIELTDWHLPGGSGWLRLSIGFGMMLKNRAHIRGQRALKVAVFCFAVIFSAAASRILRACWTPNSRGFALDNRGDGCDSSVW